MVCYPDAYIWDAHTGALVRKIISRTGQIGGCTFSPDGMSVLTASTDNVSHLWDLATGQEIRRFTGFAATVSAANLTPDGKRVAFGFTDGTVRFEPVDNKESVSWLCGKLWRDLTADERALYEIKDTEPTCPNP
jgi:WD40 repeat protein